MANQLPEVEPMRRSSPPVQCQLFEKDGYNSLHPSIRPAQCTVCVVPHEPYDKYLYPDGTTSDVHPNTICEICKISPLDEINKGKRIGPCRHPYQKQFHPKGRQQHDKISLVNVKLAVGFYDLPWYNAGTFPLCVNKEFGSRHCDANHEGSCFEFPEKPHIDKPGYRTMSSQ